MKVLDHEQLRNITLDDTELMRELLETLLDDTSRQLQMLRDAVRAQDGPRTARLAHYSKGACANIGAQTVASLLHRIERTAVTGDFQTCTASVSALPAELERLRQESLAI